ncbi:MAG: BMP family lipoprotein [Candidatus Thorarchaeota archaeon]
MRKIFARCVCLVTLMFLISPLTVIGPLIQVQSELGATRPSDGSFTESDNQFQVALVFGPKGLGNNTEYDAAYNGALAARSDFGTQFEYFVVANTSDYETVIRDLANPGFNKPYEIIICVGFDQVGALQNVSIDFPSQKFAVVDAPTSDWSSYPNVAGILFDEALGSAIVGAMAGLMTTQDYVGFMGAMDIPFINRFRDGFFYGADYYSPAITTNSTYVGDWTNTTQAELLANATYDLGADVIFEATGDAGEGVFNSAKKKNVTSPHPLWTIGVDTPKMYLGCADPENPVPPTVGLTSMVKRHEVAVRNIIGHAIYGTFQGGMTWMMRPQNDGFDYEVTSTLLSIPQSVLDEVEDFKAGIINGSVTVPGAIAGTTLPLVLQRPRIPLPADINYEVGTTGHTMTWNPVDDNPSFYRVWVDGAILIDGAWDGSSIGANVDSLSIGLHNATLKVDDGDGFSATETAWVWVYPPSSGTIVIDYSHGQDDTPTVSQIGSDAALEAILSAMGYTVVFATGGLNSSILANANALLVGSIVGEDNGFLASEISAVADWFNSGFKFLWVGCDSDYTSLPAYGDFINRNMTALLTAVGSHVYPEYVGVTDTISNAYQSYRVIATGTSTDPYVANIVRGVDAVLMHGPTLLYGSNSDTPNYGVDSVSLETFPLSNVYPLLYYNASAQVINQTPSSLPMAHVVGETGPFVAATIETHLGGEDSQATSTLLVSGASPYGDYSPMYEDEYYTRPLNGRNFVKQAIHYAIRGAYTPPYVEEGSVGPPVEFSADESGRSITWHCSDTDPSYYRILIDDTQEEQLAWDGGNVVASGSYLDDLTPGTYEVRLELVDQRSHVTSCIVSVTVLQSTLTTSPTTTTEPGTTTTQPPEGLFGGMWPVLMAVGILSFVVIAGLVLRRRPKGPPPYVPPTVPPSEPDDEAPEEVQVLRGCAPVGGKFEYKVKIVNDSPYVINNVTVTIVAYPEDCMDLPDATVKKLSRIEPGGFRSPQFTFIPSKDCVEGKILSSVSYIDHHNELETVEVEPFLIRSVCDLLEPLESTMEDFELMLGDMSASREERVVEWNPEVLFMKVEKLLPNRNFHILEAERTTEDGLFRGTIRGLAEGKYTRKKVAVRIVITGPQDAEASKVVVEGLGEDAAMLPTTIEEITSGIDAWICMNCGSGLDTEEVSQVKASQAVECQYCGRTVTIDMFRK